MNSAKFPPLAAGLTKLLAALSVLSAAGANAQTIPNPGFEADSYTVYPGYTSGNTPLTGWAGNPATRYGLNPAGGSPFADNGTVPQGVNVGFLQATDNIITNLDNTISGLTNGQSYLLKFRANARGGQSPKLLVSIDGNQLLNAGIRSVAAVSVAGEYHHIVVPFTAAGSTAALSIANDAAGDNTVVIDDFSVTPGTSPWTFETWNDDASSGVDPAYNYTHAYNLGSAAGVILNEVPFTGVPGINPSVPGKFSITGLDGLFANDPNNIAGASRTLANDFIYNGFPGTLTLNGLTPGKSYVVTLYSAGWEAPLARWATFAQGASRSTIDQDTFNNDNGIRFSVTYTADGSGNAVITTTPLQAASIHTYAFTNREAAPIANTAPSFLANPSGVQGLTGETVTLSAAATGSRPLTYQWYKGPALIPGATSSTYSFAISGVADAAFYSVKATNAVSTATSTGAFVEVYVPLLNVLHNTGVDLDGAPLDDGLIDGHYQITTNPDNPGVPDAFVQDSTVFPISDGTWLVNSGTSKWIGPRFNTSAAAGPGTAIYVYRTTFDLTGKPPGVLIKGLWSTDNPGTAIRVNGANIPGFAGSIGFNVYTPFSIDTSLLPPGTVVSGANTLEFELANLDAGYTGLRVDGISASAVPAGVAPVIVTQPKGGTVVTGSSVTLSAKAYGSAALTYQWRRNGTDIGGANGPSFTISNYSTANDGTYTVRVANSVNFAVSDGAVLAAVNVPPEVTADPQGGTYAAGDTVTLSVAAAGSTPFTYQWTFNGGDINGATNATLALNSLTPASQGTYAVRVTNPYGTDTSGNAVIVVKFVVPGLFNTGVDDSRVAMADGSPDNHYIYLANADGAPLTPPFVHDSLVFPIVAGPWVANTAAAKWVGPRVDTAGAAGGDYSYRISFDLTGFDPGSVVLTGKWATDNEGTGLLLNGNPTGNVNTVQFPSLTSFTVSTGFAAGVNTLDFNLNNAALGYTGLYITDLRALANMAEALPVLTVTVNAAQHAVLTFQAEPGKVYQIERAIDTATSPWANLGTRTLPAGGPVTFEDTATPSPRAYYRLRVLP